MAGNNGRRKKRRVAPPHDEEAARRRFLEALEAQRAHARSQTTENCAQEAPAAPVVPQVLPGFYYDETKRRYFRSSSASDRLHREELEAQQQQRVSEKKAEPKVKVRRGYGVNGHNWVAYMGQRQSDFSWSARGRDQRELIPQLLSGFLSSQVVEAQDVENDGRLTALALHPKASNLGAIGASGGRLNILGLSRMQPATGSVTPSQRILPMSTFSIGGVITSVEWRPVQEMDVLVCSLGTGQRGNSQKPSGSVGLLHVGDQHIRGIVELSSARMMKLKFVDPWTATWDPITPTRLSVGCGGPQCAAYVDTVGAVGKLQFPPTGVTTSDVHAQSFFSTGHVIANGTKSGDLWGWDLRSPRRAFEWEAKPEVGQTAGSILDLHVLNDCRRAVVQRSNGELRLVDLRTYKPVVEFMTGAPKRYLPSLRCAIDDYESVVVSGGDSQHPMAVNSFDLQSGRCVASLEVQHPATSHKRPTLVQQVQLKPGHYGSRYDGTPEVWAISRNELYVCGARSDDQAD